MALSIRKALTVAAVAALATGAFGGLAHAQKTRSAAPHSETVVVEPTLLTDFSDDRRLVGWADDVFVGTVVARSGQHYDVNIPFAEFDVRVVRAVKGRLTGTVVVEQLGGPGRDGRAVMIADDTVLVAGQTYIFATRLNHRFGYHTMAPLAGATPAADADLARLVARFSTAVRNQIVYTP